MSERIEKARREIEEVDDDAARAFATGQEPEYEMLAALHQVVARLDLLIALEEACDHEWVDITSYYVRRDGTRYYRCGRCFRQKTVKRE